MTIFRRPLFLADVRASADYLATEADEAVALRWAQAVEERIHLLEQWPEFGRPRLDLPFPNVRSLTVQGFPNYIILYRVEGAVLELLRVKHGAMNLAELQMLEEPPA